MAVYTSHHGVVVRHDLWALHSACTTASRPSPHARFSSCCPRAKKINWFAVHPAHGHHGRHVHRTRYLELSSLRACCPATRIVHNCTAVAESVGHNRADHVHVHREQLQQESDACAVAVYRDHASPVTRVLVLEHDLHIANNCGWAGLVVSG